MERLAEVRSRRKAGEHLRAFDLVEQILREPGDPSEKALAAMEGYFVVTAMEDYPRAVHMAQQSLTWAHTAANPALIAAGNYHTGTALVNAGEWRDGQEHLEAFLVSERHPDTDRYRGAAMFNRGVAFLGQRSYRAATDAFRGAEETYSLAGDAPNVARCLLEAAWAELMAGRPEPAGLYLERAAVAMGDNPDVGLQHTALCHRAFYHMGLKEYALATQLCVEVLAPGRPGVTAHHRSEAAWVAGECALVVHQLESARVMAALAVSEGVRAQWSTLINRGNQLEQRIRSAQEGTA